MNSNENSGSRGSAQSGAVIKKDVDVAEVFSASFRVIERNTKSKPQAYAYMIGLAVLGVATAAVTIWGIIEFPIIALPAIIAFTWLGPKLLLNKKKK